MQLVKKKKKKITFDLVLVGVVAVIADAADVDV